MRKESLLEVARKSINLNVLTGYHIQTIFQVGGNKKTMTNYKINILIIEKKYLKNLNNLKYRIS